MRMGGVPTNCRIPVEESRMRARKGLHTLTARRRVKESDDNADYGRRGRALRGDTKVLVTAPLDESCVADASE